MARRRAVLCLLWDRHLGVLEPYLHGSGIEVVVAPALHATPRLREIVESAGCQLVVLDAGDRPRLAQRTAETVAALTAYASSTAWMPGLDGDTRDGVRQVLQRRLAVDIPASMHLLDCLRTVQLVFDIALLVTSEDLTEPSKLATSWARAHGVPSVHVAHSIALVEPYTVHAGLTADVLAVYGPRGAEGYLDLGIDPERIVTTGNPAWDGYAGMRAQRPDVRRALMQVHSLDSELPVVVFGTTWGGHRSALEAADVHPRSLAIFIDACEELFADGVRFNAVVKDRPSNVATGEQLFVQHVRARSQDPERYTYATDDPARWAVGADILVAVESNFLVEAMLGGTAGINLVYQPLPRPPVFDAGSGITDADPDELGVAIRRLLDPVVRAQKVAEATARIDHYQVDAVAGEATRRVADLMRRMTRPPPVSAQVEQSPDRSPRADQAPPLRRAIGRLTSSWRRRP